MVFSLRSHTGRSLFLDQPTSTVHGCSICCQHADHSDSEAIAVGHVVFTIISLSRLSLMTLFDPCQSPAGPVETSCSDLYGLSMNECTVFVSQDRVRKTEMWRGGYVVSCT